MCAAVVARTTGPMLRGGGATYARERERERELHLHTEKTRDRPAGSYKNVLQDATAAVNRAA